MNSATPSHEGIVDVHQHIISDPFRSLLHRRGITGGAGEELAPWSLEQTLDTMDRCGIGVSMLSYTISGITIDDRGFLKELCRASNEALAGAIAQSPDRLGGFAFLPLPDVAGTLDEIAYAMDTLKLDGVGMHSNMGGIYPGDQRFDPVMEELDRRGSVVHLHPTDIPESGGRALPWPPYIVEFIFETCRAAANLVYSGALDRFQDVSFILSHAGGAVPFLASRLWTGEFTIPGLAERCPSGVLGCLKRFYYDTGMAANAAVFGALLETTDTGHLLFGTDYPYMPDIVIGGYLDEINRYAGFGEEDRASITGGNARDLFPRLRNGKK